MVEFVLYRKAYDRRLVTLPVVGYGANNMVTDQPGIRKTHLSITYSNVLTNAQPGSDPTSVCLYIS
jgi:hypothetical protein